MLPQNSKSKIFLFSIASHIVVAIPTWRYQKFPLLISLLIFLYKYFTFVHSFFFSGLLPIWLSLFQLLSLFIPLGWKSDNFNESNQEKKQRTDAKNEATKIKSDKFTRSYREKSNIAIAILHNEQLDSTIIILLFGGTSNIFVECRLFSTFFFKSFFFSSEVFL